MPRSSKVYRNLVLATLMDTHRPKPGTKVIKERKCPQCGKVHRERGGFCSAICHDRHKEEHPPPM